jgi:protein-disulfide isomerase
MNSTNGISATVRAGRSLLAALGAPAGPRPGGGRPWLLYLALLGAGAMGGAAATAAIEGPTPTLATADRARIEAVVRDYILTHPEIIPEALRKLQDKRVAQVVDAHRAEIEKPYAGAWEGAADGDVTLVEFFDYACGFCRASVADIKRLLAEDKKLKVVYRELPILSDMSGLAARVSLHAAEAGRYAAFHHAMYESGSVTRQDILAAAAKAGLDRAKVQSILDARASPAEIANNIRLAQAVDASGTPLFIVGDQVLNGAVGYDALKEAIAKARAKKGGT